MERSENTLKKVKRVQTAMKGGEPDQIPIFEYFWTHFIEAWREELGLASDADPYKYYDIDLINICPNLDPTIKPFEILKENDEETVVKTGFGATVRKVHSSAMPGYIDFELDSIEKVESFEFGDPWDERRYFKAGDSHMHGVGDAKIVRNTPSFIDDLKEKRSYIAVFGSVIDASEFMARAIGTENQLLWMGMYPEEIGRFIERIHDYMIEIAKAQIKAADGMLDGFFLAGDIAYTNSMMCSPDYWRKYFKPGIAEIIKIAHDNNLTIMNHGCGDTHEIINDYIEIGLDGYHPFECKAGYDLVELRKQLGHKLTFFGNNDVEVWATGDKEKIKEYTLRKLNAGKDGRLFFGADHSVPASVSGQIYDYVIKLVREYGKYPLKLGEYDLLEAK